MSFKSISVGKFTLTHLNFNLTEGEKEKFNTDAKFQVGFSETDSDEVTSCNTEIEANITGNGYTLDIKLSVSLKVEGFRKIDKEEDLNEEELNMLITPLLKKTSEIVSYVTANALPLPEIITIRTDEISIEPDFSED